MTLDTTMGGDPLPNRRKSGQALSRTPLRKGLAPPIPEAPDPRYPCMGCNRRPSDYILDEPAPDGGRIWVCHQCYAHRRTRPIVIGSVGRTGPSAMP